LIAVYSISVLQKEDNETFINGANRTFEKPIEFELIKKLLSEGVTTFFK
jgi:hypothetical protein